MKECESEEELEGVENEPSYIHASWEKFSSKPTDIGAKYLWLKYTSLNEKVPDDVIKRMKAIIEYDIQLYEDNHTPYGALIKKEKEEPVYALLHCAKEDPERFWDVLEKPDKKDGLFIICDEDLLEETRITFPHKRKLKPRELYTFFGRQLGMKEEETGEDIGEKMRLRYRTYKKYKKNEELLFE